MNLVLPIILWLSLINEDNNVLLSQKKVAIKDIKSKGLERSL